MAGNFIYAGCQWSMLIALAKFASPEIVGQFSLGAAITGPIMMISALQLRAIQSTDTNRDFKFGHYLAMRLITTVLGILLIASIAFGAGYRLETALVIVAFGVAKAVEAISDILYGQLQQRERMDSIARSMMIKGPLSLIAFAVAVYATKSAFGGCLGLIGAWGAVMVGYDIPVTRDLLKSQDAKHQGQESTLTPRWDWSILRRMLQISFPLGLAMMLSSLNFNIPRYFVEHRFGERELGIFAAMAYLLVIGTQIISALGQSASPRLAAYHATGDRESFRTLVIKLLIISSGLGVLGVLAAVVAGKTLLSLLYTPEYAQHSSAFVVLSVAGGLFYVTSILGYAATAARRIHSQPLILALLVASTFLICFVGIERYGLMGAAMSLVVSGLVGIVAYGWLLVVAVKA